MIFRDPGPLATKFPEEPTAMVSGKERGRRAPAGRDGGTERIVTRRVDGMVPSDVRGTGGMDTTQGITSMTTSPVRNPSSSTRARAARPPRISVVLPTRDRGTAVLTPIAAIRRGSWQDFEICVVDQSARVAETAAALTALGDPRIRHLPSRDRGLARALNRGIDAARAELIAVTGDDCEPADDWLESVVTTFDHHPVVGVVHGNVEPCDHDATRGFVQASVRTDTVTVHAVEDLPTLVGTSANIAIRRAVATALAGFDETFGVGAPLAAAEDVDFVLRALAGGWAVHEAPAIRVTHQDIWPLHRRAELIRRNWYGTGAVFGKFARQQPRSAVGLLGRLARRFVARPVGVSVSLGGGHRWARLVAFTGGFLAGFTRPLDRARGHFAASPPRHPAG
ncbi:MAG: glycosyltransferase [Planctomycetes bacterium]|nr:glycosyltransferase [Planctomycetota bacterium]